MNRSKLAIAAALLLATAASATAQQRVYQWKDASGVTHYSQTPPPKGKYQQRQITSQGASIPQPVNATATTAETNPQCTTARANVEALKGTSPVHEAGADGKPGRALSDSERSSQLELANAAVKAYCTTRPAD